MLAFGFVQPIVEGSEKRVEGVSKAPWYEMVEMTVDRP
jgi:hypothetical protein